MSLILIWSILAGFGAALFGQSVLIGRLLIRINRLTWRLDNEAMQRGKLRRRMKASESKLRLRLRKVESGSVLNYASIQGSIPIPSELEKRVKS